MSSRCLSEINLSWCLRHDALVKLPWSQFKEVSPSAWIPKAVRIYGVSATYQQPCYLLYMLDFHLTLCFLVHHEWYCNSLPTSVTFLPPESKLEVKSVPLILLDLAHSAASYLGMKHLLLISIKAIYWLSSCLDLPFLCLTLCTWPLTSSLKSRHLIYLLIS